MLHSFIFDGWHSLDNLGLEVELVSLPLFPEPKTVCDDIPGTDGELNLSTFNPSKRMYFKPRIIEFKCHGTFDPNVPGALNKRLQDLAYFLFTGEDKFLEVSCDYPYLYKAHTANLFNVTIESDSSFSFPLVFKCQPFRLEDFLSFERAADNTFVVYNDGYFTDFQIEIPGPIKAPLIVRSSCFPDKELIINRPCSDEEFMVIDSAKRDVFVDDISVLDKCSGDFFEIAPDVNRITLGGNQDKLTATLVYIKQYL